MVSDIEHIPFKELLTRGKCILSELDVKHSHVFQLLSATTHWSILGPDDVLALAASIPE
jgi:hypothetical protein